MKHIFTILIGFWIVSCQTSSKENAAVVPEKKLPSELEKIIDHHGGLTKWQSMKSMSYELVKEPQNEIQKVDLQNRKEIIKASDYTTGFDGSRVWLAADTSYKRNPVFYHNLMFYFIAMPFVLADDGIVFKEAQPLEFDGVAYPGLRIAYEDDIGLSPEDEYFIHYNPDTYRMEWLGYTVTYFSQEKSTDIHWIRYQDWKIQNGLLLPNSLDWYKYENGLPTEFRNKVELANFNVLESKYDQSIFEKIEEAEFVE